MGEPPIDPGIVSDVCSRWPLAYSREGVGPVGSSVNADIIFLAGDTFMIPQKEEMNSTSESVPVLNVRTEAFRKCRLRVLQPNICLMVALRC